MIATVTLNPSLDEWVRLPSLRLGDLNRAVWVGRYPGGKGVNVSRVIHELGGRTIALALSGGEDGLMLRQLMRRLSIPHECIAVRGSTRNNYKILTAHPRGLTEINTAGPAVSTSTLRRLEQRLFECHPAPRCVVLSGSLPPGAPSDTYQRWIVALHRRRIPVALDSSGAALRLGVAARPWLIKPNRQEAEELLRRRLTRLASLIDAATRLLRNGPEVVVLSLGDEGALMASSAPAGVWVARPPRAKVESAVGAGDSLVGGFIMGWETSRSMVEALRWGVASGTASAMTPGTELCHRADVRRLRLQVTVRRVA